MSLFARRKREAPEERAAAADQHGQAAQGPDLPGTVEGGRTVESGRTVEGAGTVEGERSIPSVNRVRSLQSRVSSFLAAGLMSAIGLAFLAWYYSGAITRSSHAMHAAESASEVRAKGDVPLPSLGHIEPPGAQATEPERSALDAALGPAPDLPSPAATAAWNQSEALVQAPHVNAGVPAQKTPGELAFERRLSGSVFARSSDATHAMPTSLAASPAGPMPASEGGMPTQGADSRGLATLLQPSTTPAVAARVLPTREFLLAKGAFIDCTLETAIDSTLPGMVTCITATDTFGSDGRIVLLERGTKLIGETRGQVQQGTARLFVLWTEARTPAGVVVPLASPGTDELGRAGLPGKVDRHFWDRFGAAILISIVQGAVQAAAQSGSGQGTVIVNPSVSSDVMTEVLRSSIAIPPTIRKRQGDRIQVLVARDLDFRSVYELRAVPAQGAAEGTP